jgi:hypothetical protein
MQVPAAFEARVFGRPKSRFWIAEMSNRASNVYSMAARHQKECQWNAAKKRCRFNDEEVQMAKQLGIGPRTLIKNIPSPSERWKQPVREWVRNLYAKKFENQCSNVGTSKTSLAARDGYGRASRASAPETESDLIDADSDVDIPF